MGSAEAWGRALIGACSTTSGSPRRWWISVAAAVLLVGVLAMHLSQRPPMVVKADTQVVSVAVLADAAGFQPMPEGKITVTRGTQ